MPFPSYSILSSAIQVFVSSTFLDLQAERQAVEAVVQRMRETKFVGMEYFGSRDETTKGASLEEVERSDIFIGIFAGRYGSGIAEDEYRRARERGLDRFIYFKDEAAIPPDQGEADSEMAARLARLKQELRREHLVSVFANPDDLAAKVTADLHRWLVDKRLTTPREQAYSMRTKPAPIEPEDHRGLGDLLHKVNSFWIKGVLENSVHGVVLIEIGKKRVSEAVEHPWERVLELPGQSSQTLPPDKSMGDIFQESGWSLLILGEPGSGKTTTLLELTRDLFLRAEHDTAQPVPVVLNLSSWARQSIFDWLVDELSTKYFVAKRHARSWLKENRLMLLLDGLDEVRGDHRAACVNAINRFAQDVGVPGLAVCSRTNEYVALGVRLKLHGAICLQPLKLQQVNAYLSEAGPELGALSAALQQDTALQSLAQSPLMLAVMSLAYRDASVETLSSEQLRTAEARQRHVFATYINRMFERRGRGAQPYAKEQSITWLSWLAQKMTEQSQSIFLIERIQPSWLSSRGQRVLYTFISRIASGLSYGLTFGLFLTMLLVMGPVLGPDSPSLGELLESAPGSIRQGSETLVRDWFEWLPESTREEVTPQLASISWQRWIASFISTFILYGAICGLGAGLFDALRFQRFYEPISLGRLMRLWLLAKTTLVYGLAGAALLFIFQAVYFTIHRLDMPGQLLVVNAVVTGLLFGIPFALRGTTRTVTSDIQTLGRLTWSWRRALMSGTVGMAILSFFAAYRFRLLWDHWLLIGLAVGSAYFPLGAVLGGLTRGSVEKTVSPNQGIRLSLRNAVFGGLSLAVAVPLLGFAFYLLSSMIVVVTLGAYYQVLEWTYISNAWNRLTNYPLYVYVLVPFSLALGLIMALGAYGGLDVIQHYILRAIVWRKRCAPRDYGRFLDYAVSLIFLQKVGGAYIFIHRLLLEHFAALKTAEEPSTVYELVSNRGTCQTL